MQGTGFVIDVPHAYVLTAGHVVAQAQKEPIFTTGRNNERIGLKLIKTLYPKVDAALLQFNSMTLTLFRIAFERSLAADASRAHG